MRKDVIRQVAFKILPTIMAVILILIVSIWKIPSSVINSLLFLSFLTCLRFATEEKKLKQKAEILVNAFLNGIVALIINVSNYGLTLISAEFPENLYNWLGIWLLLILGVIIWFTVTLFKEILPYKKGIDEEEDGQVQQMKGQESQVVLGKKKTGEIAEPFNEHRESKDDEEMQQLVTETKKDNRKKAERKGFPGLVLLLILALYLVLPLGNTDTYNFNIVEKWINGIENFTEVLSEEKIEPTEDEETLEFPEMQEEVKNEAVQKNSKIRLLFSYTIYFIAIVGCMVSALYLMYHFIVRILETSGKQKEDDRKEFFSSFFEQYSTAIIVMVIGTAVCLSFEPGQAMDVSGEIYKGLMIVVVDMVIALVMIDIVRLALDQCIRETSLLRCCFRYVYLLVIKVAMEVVVGILSGLHIKEMLTSLLALFLPGQDKSIYQQADNGIEQAIREELRRLTNMQDTEKKEKEAERFCSKTFRGWRK